MNWPNCGNLWLMFRNRLTKNYDLNHSSMHCDCWGNFISFKAAQSTITNSMNLRGVILFQLDGNVGIVKHSFINVGKYEQRRNEFVRWMKRFCIRESKINSKSSMYDGTARSWLYVVILHFFGIFFFKHLSSL